MNRTLMFGLVILMLLASASAAPLSSDVDAYNGLQNSLNKDILGELEKLYALDPAQAQEDYTNYLWGQPGYEEKVLKNVIDGQTTQVSDLQYKLSAEKDSMKSGEDQIISIDKILGKNARMKDTDNTTMAEVKKDYDKNQFVVTIPTNSDTTGEGPYKFWIEEDGNVVSNVLTITIIKSGKEIKSRGDNFFSSGWTRGILLSILGIVVIWKWKKIGKGITNVRGRFKGNKEALKKLQETRDLMAKIHLYLAAKEKFIQTIEVQAKRIHDERGIDLEEAKRQLIEKNKEKKIHVPVIEKDYTFGELNEQMRLDMGRLKTILAELKNTIKKEEQATTPINSDLQEEIAEETPAVEEGSEPEEQADEEPADEPEEETIEGGSP